jgi:hypothetical protein
MALPPLPLGGPPLVPPAQTATFTEYYAEATYNKHNQNYANVMNIFSSPGGLQTPAQLRELVSNNPRELSLGFAVLSIPTNNPAHTGTIYAIHSIAKFASRLGQPAAQWDDHIYGSINETVGNQGPTTVEFPNDAFTRLGGGALYQVGLAQRMDAMYNADPNLGVLGPFGKFDAGTELVQSRNIVPIPHCYMRHFIRGPPLHAHHGCRSSGCN